MFWEKNNKVKAEIILHLAYAIPNEMNSMVLAFEFHKRKIKQALNKF